MLSIIFAALCVAVISAESSSLSSYSSGPSSLRDYSEYSGSSSGSYLSGKPSYTDLGAAATYVAVRDSPYSKSDSRYSSADTSGDSSDPRTTLSGSFYKSKYGNEAVVNALRPTSYQSSSSSSSSSTSSDQPSIHYTGDYTASSGHPSSSSSYYDNSAAHGSSSSGTSSEYATSGGFTYGDRNPSEHHLQHLYSGGDSGSSGQSEYTVQSSRPSSSIYNGYSSGGQGLSEYSQGRPTTYSHSGLVLSGDYPSTGNSGSSHHHHHSSQPSHHRVTAGYSLGSEEYSSSPSHSIQSQPQHGYKTYVMSSSPSSSSYPSKYQSVFGALKSLFGGGSDTAPSSSHVYSAGPSSGSGYYSSGLHGGHHHAPASYAAASAPSSVSAGGPGYYFGSGSSGSSSPYSKSYAPMRFVMGHGGNANPGGKIIVVRDSSSGHSSSYPSSLGSPSSYVAKGKIGFAPSSSGPSYLSASPSSLSQSYSSGPPSSSYSSSYPSSSSSSSSSGFGSGHGGSTFLGYSA